MNGNVMEPSVDVLVLTTRDVERRAVWRALPKPESAQHQGRIFHRASLGPYLVVVPPSLGAGEVSAAAEIRNIISTWNPACVLLVGVLAGLRLSPELQCGDVLVPDRPGGQAAPGDQEPISQQYLPALGLLTAARHVDREAWVPRIEEARPRSYGVDRGHPVAHVGPVVDGLRHGLLRLEVENLGLLAAAYQGSIRPKFMIIKGVYDEASGSSESGQSYAAQSAASFMAALLETVPFDARSQTMLHLSVPSGSGGTAKIEVCRRLVTDWEDLADYFEIKPYQRARFQQGREPQEIWEWLEVRSMLHALPNALNMIGRPDLIPLLELR